MEGLTRIGQDWREGNNGMNNEILACVFSRPRRKISLENEELRWILDSVRLETSRGLDWVLKKVRKKARKLAQKEDWSVDKKSRVIGALCDQAKQNWLLDTQAKNNATVLSSGFESKRIRH